jgi:hypothetical protein
MLINSQLQNLCSSYGPLITGITHEGVAVPGRRLLLTIAGLESSFGEKREYVRMEAAFAPGGKYYKINEPLRALYSRYGCLAASSFGTFQVMFITATELGFTGKPWELQDDNVCAEWATKLITKRFIRGHGAKTLRDILDAYNSGAHADKYIPTIYIERGFKIYGQLSTV